MSGEEFCAGVGAGLVVFDLDGTLYDKRALALRMILSQFGHLKELKAEREVRRTLAGVDFGTSKEFYRRFYGDIAALTGGTPESVSRWYNESYMPSMVTVLSRHYGLRKWIGPAIVSLHSRGVRVAVFSDYPFAAEKLAALGFDASWADAGVFDAPSLGGLKPSRESFLRLSSATGVLPGDITVIGDRADTDIEGARRSGMNSFLV